MFHYRKNHLQKTRYPKITGCHFCADDMPSRTIVETKHAVVIANRAFYDRWELRPVTDHLLLVPKRHVASLAELTKEERFDIMALMADYEAQNYNIYARGVSSKQRTVGHQHTHLIKTKDKQARGSFSWFKPYIFLTFD
jgi:diadenosine tetraphosphate (Ap4A) HIT family hydrolase